MGIFDRFFQKNKEDNKIKEEKEGKAANNDEPRNKFAQEDIMDMTGKSSTSEKIKREQMIKVQELREKIIADVGNNGQKNENEIKDKGFELVDGDIRFPLNVNGYPDPSTALEFRNGADNEKAIKDLEKTKERRRNWVDIPYQK